MGTIYLQSLLAHYQSKHIFVAQSYAEKSQRATEKNKKNSAVLCAFSAAALCVTD